MDEVRNESEKAKATIEELGHVPVSPLDVSPNPDAPYSEHIGKDISALLECEATCGEWCRGFNEKEDERGFDD